MNPFDDPDGTFLILTNEAGQHSLWPTFLSAPDGWAQAWGPGSRDDALAWVDANWPDITVRYP